MTGNTTPPALATRVLLSLLPEFSRDAVLGDLHESFTQITLEAGHTAARRWYWGEVLKAIPSFSLHALRNTHTRRQIVNGTTMNESWLGRQGSRLTASIGLLLLAPAVVVEGFALAYALSDKSSGAALLSLPGASHLLAAMYSGTLSIGGLELPIGIVVLAGIFLAAAINFFAIVQFRINSVQDGIQTTVTIKRRLWNLLLLGLVFVLLLGMDWLIS